MVVIDEFRRRLFERMQEALGYTTESSSGVKLDLMRARLLPERGLMSLPVPLAFNGEPRGTGALTIWAFPGELRVSLILPKSVAQFLDKDSGFSGIWSGGTDITMQKNADPHFTTENQDHHDGSSTLYQWRFVGGALSIEHWFSAVQEPEAAGSVFIDAIIARTVHLWDSLAHALMHIGYEVEIREAR